MVAIDSLAYTTGDAGVYGSGEVMHGVGCGRGAASLTGAGIGTGGVTAADGVSPIGVYGAVGYVGYALSVSGCGPSRLRGISEGYTELAVLGMGSKDSHNWCREEVGDENSLVVDGVEAVVCVVVGEESVCCMSIDSVCVSGERAGGTGNSTDLDATAALGLAAKVGLTRRDVSCVGPVDLVSVSAKLMLSAEGESGGVVLSTGVVVVAYWCTGVLDDV